MAKMTDEEANALDELLTRTTPKLGPNGTGFFSGKGFQIIASDIQENKLKFPKTRKTPQAQGRKKPQNGSIGACRP